MRDISAKKHTFLENVRLALATPTFRTPAGVRALLRHLPSAPEATSGDPEKHAFRLRHPSLLAPRGTQGPSKLPPKSDHEIFHLRTSFFLPPRRHSSDSEVSKVRDVSAKTPTFFENVRLAWARATFASQRAPNIRTRTAKRASRLGETHIFVKSKRFS